MTEDGPGDGPEHGPEGGHVSGDPPGRALGVDLGTRRIGVAITDSAGTMALPRSTLERSGDPEHDRRKLVEIIVDEAVATVVVGLPLSLDGSSGPAASSAREEAEALRTLLEGRGIDVELFDERLTTVSAHQALAARGVRGRDRRSVVDQTAAAVMLSAWLESGGGR
ncbi:MAG: Holliday junction resolvase RuvX [Acidimicrobiales bacterium]